MNSLLFRIFCTTLILLHKNFVFATELHDFIIAIKEPTYSETEELSKEFRNKSLLILVHDKTEKEFNTYDEDIERLKNDPNLSDEILQIKKDSIKSLRNGNTELRMGGQFTTVGKSRRTATRVRTIRTTVNKDRLNAREKDHQRRMKEIIDHMNKYFISSIYLYNETMRIERTHVILDELRIMAIDAMQPKYKTMKENIMKCAYVPPKPAHRPIEGKTNNLVINIVQDSINDGVPIR